MEGAEERGPKIKSAVNHQLKNVKKMLSYRLGPLERKRKHKKSKI